MGTSVETSLELIKNQWSTEFKSGYSGGVGIVGEGNLIFKIVPVKI